MFKINIRVVSELMIAQVILIGVLALVLILMVPPAAAELQYYQSYYTNNPLQLRVNQGDHIFLGKIYDMEGVIGLSGKIAYWKDWKNENTDCAPSKIVDLRFSKRATFLGPQFSSGNWYFWDEYECNITSLDYGNGSKSGITRIERNAPLSHDNKLAFTIVNPPAGHLITEVHPMYLPIEKYESAYT